MLPTSFRVATVSRMTVFCAVILAPYILSNDYSSILIVSIGFFLVIFNKLERTYFKLAWPLFGVLFIGVLGVFDHESRHIFRDIAYAIMPIALIYIGHWIAGVRSVRSPLFKVIVLLGFGMAVVHLAVFVNNPEILSYGALEVRQVAVSTGHLVTLALALATFQNRFGLDYLFPRLLPRFVVIPVLMASLVLSYSRTEYIVALIFLLSLWGVLIRFNTRTVLMASTLAVVFFVITITTPRHEVGTFRSKITNSFRELSVSDYRFKQDINSNWRGFETYRALKTFKSGTIFQQMTGQGFGSLVDLGYFQELGDESFRYIPITHNGYVYVLLKTGIVGLLLYVIFYVKIIRVAVLNSDSTGGEVNFFTLLLLGCVLSLVATMFVVGGMAEMHGSELVIFLGYLTRCINQFTKKVERDLNA